MHHYVPEDTIPKGISQIQFGMFSGPEMARLSGFPVVNRELYQHLTTQPMPHGPLDEHMGVSSKRAACKTCGEKIENCPGHFGFIKLSLPVFHIGYIKSIYHILKMICKSCSSVLLSAESKRDYLASVRSKKLDFNQKKSVYAKVLKECQKASTCQSCGEFNGDVKKVGPLKFVHDKYKSKAAEMARTEWERTFEAAAKSFPEISEYVKNCGENLHPLIVRELFQSILPEDCELLGMSHRHARPEWMVLTHLLVPPCPIRPSIQMDQQGGSNEDDLTMKIQEIIWISDQIRAGLEKGMVTARVVEIWGVLQLQVAQYMNSEFPGVPQNLQTKKPIRGLCQRLKGKQGRFRGNLSGKRVDFTSRTVISPDPNLRIDEVGVPMDVAMTLTYPEKVNRYNLERMRQLVINGPFKHPGAIYIYYPSDGSRRLLKYGDRAKVAASLRHGDVVERHLSDGDTVLFNRQPSLHRISIMSHRARVMRWKTFRFNECVCAPYNADFDGDEMNLHLPQTEEARAEAMTLMNVAQNLAAPKSGELLISATQDFLTASWIITSKDRFFGQAEFSRVVMGFLDADQRVCLPSPAILKPARLFTGKQVFSVLIQPNRSKRVNVNLETKLRNYDNKLAGEIMNVQDAYMVIHNGHLMCGQLDKSVLGGGKNTLFSQLLKCFNAQVAADRMSRLARLCARYLGEHGFSIGISDVTPSHALICKKASLVADGYQKCDEYIREYLTHELVQEAGATPEQTLESRLESTLSEIRDSAGKLCIDELSQNDPLNSPLIMTLCGSKGSKINVSQMIACVGQQTVSGQRIPNGFLNRTLPHFDFESKHPAAKGFVSNSFFSGLTPTEFFFHTMGGREGLVDTAVKTAETGYMQRRLMKALEDLSVQYDGTVRGTTGNIVQFTYGDDGVEPTLTESDIFPFDLKSHWQHSVLTVLEQTRESCPTNPPPPPLPPWQILETVHQRLLRPVFQQFPKKFLQDIRHHFVSEDLSLLIEWDRLHSPSRDSRYPSLFAAKIASLSLDDSAVVDHLVRLRFNLGLDPLLTPPPTDHPADPREALSSQLVHVSSLTLSHFFEHLERKLLQSQAEPGTAVGALCGQSIGEPCTQMTLKTFHFAGVASMNITLGVPRIREIINATKTISTPIIEVKLDNETSAEASKLVKARIESTTLEEVIQYIKEVYDSHQCYLLVKLDLARIRSLYLSCDAHSVSSSILSHPKLKLQPEHVVVTGKNHDKIMVFPPEELGHSKKTTLTKSKLYISLQALKLALPNVVVSGLKTIKRCVIREDRGKAGAPNQYSILVDGLDLLGVMSQQGVNPNFTKSNHLLQIQKTLGIEAARRAIIEETAYTMKLHGVSVDPRHLYLLADYMTMQGEILGITRFGIGKTSESALMLASFEKTPDYLFEAGKRAFKESISGVSECIIMGRPIPLGTGLCRLIYQHPDLKPEGTTLAPKQLLLGDALPGNACKF